jgi:hypothetical protein
VSMQTPHHVMIMTIPWATLDGKAPPKQFVFDDVVDLFERLNGEADRSLFPPQF